MNRIVIGAMLLVSSVMTTTHAVVQDIPDLEKVQDRLHISTEMARVIDASDTDTGAYPEFILIQDAHRYPRVQSRIAALIRQAYDQWGVRKVFMEGAFTSIDFTVFHRLPERTQQMLADRLVKEGNLSGAELAAIKIMEKEWRNPPVSPFQVFGMEDPDVYRANVIAYQQALREQERGLQELGSIRRLQEEMKFSPNHPIMLELKRLDALLHLRITPTDLNAHFNAKQYAPQSPGLDPAVKAAEEFYRIAGERTQIFLNEATRRAPANTAPRILVTGGFHTADLAALLRQDHKSFIVLSPTITAEEEDSRYAQRLQETANTLAKALSEPTQ